MSYKYHNGKFDLEKDWEKIFVFGSNLLGQHGGGAAKFAYDHCGATWGVGQGIQNDAMSEIGSYALPTKYTPSMSMNWWEVRAATTLFKAYATTIFHSTDDNIEFFVTAVGTGLAGFDHETIAPMFRGSPPNCIFPPEWKEFLEVDDAEG